MKTSWVALTLVSAASFYRAVSNEELAMVKGVFIELSIGSSIPLDWEPDVFEYSLAIPRDAPLAAVRVAIGKGEQPSEDFGGALALRVPLRGLAFAMEARTASALVEIDTDKQAVLKLDIGSYEFTINVIRSKIASTGQVEQPDPARRFPPRGTLAGLAIWDSTGRAAHMAWFTPRTSTYFASVGDGARGIRLVATANDPDAELEWRRNGGKWDFLVSGLTSASASVSTYGWTLLEVRVRSTAAYATGTVSEPLVYQIAVTKELVCHPKCRSCSGPSFSDCTSCYAPLILSSGRCVYTACHKSGVFFDFNAERCLSCHESCKECQGGSAQSCTVCPPMSFFLTASVVHVVGECVRTCPFGYFVQPVSQRCQRAPVGLQLQKFYFRLNLRILATEFLDEEDLLPNILKVATETLRVSPQDVRFHKWEEATSGFAVLYYFEVENPFLRKEEVEKRLSIDDWFSALPVPVDSITVMSNAQLYPPPPVPKPEPFIQPWLLGVIISGALGILVICPMYHFYFVRMHFQKTPFKPKTERMEQFVTDVMKNARDDEITAAASVVRAR